MVHRWAAYQDTPHDVHLGKRLRVGSLDSLDFAISIENAGEPLSSGEV
jgi:hypothetical protein